MDKAATVGKASAKDMPDDSQEIETLAKGQDEQAASFSAPQASCSLDAEGPHMQKKDLQIQQDDVWNASSSSIASSDESESQSKKNMATAEMFVLTIFVTLLLTAFSGWKQS